MHLSRPRPHLSFQPGLRLHSGLGGRLPRLCILCHPGRHARALGGLLQRGAHPAKDATSARLGACRLALAAGKAGLKMLAEPLQASLLIMCPELHWVPGFGSSPGRLAHGLVGGGAPHRLPDRSTPSPWGTPRGTPRGTTSRPPPPAPFPRRRRRKAPASSSTPPGIPLPLLSTLTILRRTL